MVISEVQNLSVCHRINQLVSLLLIACVNNYVSPLYNNSRRQKQPNDWKNGSGRALEYNSLLKSKRLGRCSWHLVGLPVY